MLLGDFRVNLTVSGSTASMLAADAVCARVIDSAFTVSRLTTRTNVKVIRRVRSFERRKLFNIFPLFLVIRRNKRCNYSEQTFVPRHPTLPSTRDNLL